MVNRSQRGADGVLREGEKKNGFSRSHWSHYISQGFASLCSDSGEGEDGATATAQGEGRSEGRQQAELTFARSLGARFQCLGSSLVPPKPGPGRGSILASATNSELAGTLCCIPCASHVCRSWNFVQRG